MDLGSHYRIKTKHTLYNTRKDISTDAGQTESITGLCEGTTSKGIHPPLKESVQLVLLLWMSCVNALMQEGSNCLGWRAGMAMAVL